MPLPTFAQVSDLEDDGDVDDKRRARSSLVKVSTAIRSETGQSWVDADGALVSMTAFVADLLRTVTVEATLRRLRNPDGATSRSQTMGPFAESITVEADNVFFTAVERGMLDQAVTEQFPETATYPGLGVIGIARGDIETAQLLCEPSVWDSDE